MPEKIDQNTIDVKLVNDWNTLAAQEEWNKVFLMDQFNENMKKYPLLDVINKVNHSKEFTQNDKWYNNAEDYIVSFNNIGDKKSPIDFKLLCWIMHKRFIEPQKATTK